MFLYKEWVGPRLLKPNKTDGSFSNGQQRATLPEVWESDASSCFLWDLKHFPNELLVLFTNFKSYLTFVNYSHIDMELDDETGCSLGWAYFEVDHKVQDGYSQKC